MAVKKEWCEVNRKIEAFGETFKITGVGKTAVLAEDSHGEESMVRFEEIDDIANA
jgi:hypothetical protein